MNSIWSGISRSEACGSPLKKVKGRCTGATRCSATSRMPKENSAQHSETGNAADEVVTLFNVGDRIVWPLKSSLFFLMGVCGH